MPLLFSSKHRFHASTVAPAGFLIFPCCLGFFPRSSNSDLSENRINGFWAFLTFGIGKSWSFLIPWLISAWVFRLLSPQPFSLALPCCHWWKSVISWVPRNFKSIFDCQHWTQPKRPLSAAENPGELLPWTFWGRSSTFHSALSKTPVTFHKIIHSFQSYIKTDFVYQHSIVFVLSYKSYDKKAWQNL